MKKVVIVTMISSVLAATVGVLTYNFNENQRKANFKKDGKKFDF